GDGRNLIERNRIRLLVQMRRKQNGGRPSIDRAVELALSRPVFRSHSYEPGAWHASTAVVFESVAELYDDFVRHSLSVGKLFPATPIHACHARGHTEHNRGGRTRRDTGGGGAHEISQNAAARVEELRHVDVVLADLVDCGANT